MFLVKILNPTWGALAATLALASCGGSSANQYADTVFRNGYVLTMNDSQPTSQAVAVKNGKIIYVGNDGGVNNFVGSSTKVMDLGGKLMLPGFIDAHVHSLAGGRALTLCDMQYAPLHITEMVAKLQSCLNASASQEPDSWLEAVNWDRQATSGLDGRDPNLSDLASLTGSRPIAITSSDFHAVLANSRALSLAGISAATADPAGGRYLRDGSGNPTGIAEDSASFIVKAAIPPDSDAYLLRQGRAALQAFRQQGVTSFMDAASDAIHAKTFRTLQQAGELTARANLTFVMSPEEAKTSIPASVAAAKAFLAANDQGTAITKPGINARIVKLFNDGVVNAPADAAKVFTPYYTFNGMAWVPGTNVGSTYFDQDTVLKPLLVALSEAQLDVHIHATGEGTVQETLNAIENLRTLRPSADFRPAIAHDETVAVADYPRFALLNVIPTMSFQWAQRASYSVGETENHLGPDRFSRMEPFGSLHNAGARIAYGSDWPIDPYDIMLALKIGVTRSGDPLNPNSPASRDTRFVGPINADPALSRIEVLKAITINAAYQLRLEKLVGSIEVGKFADLIVLEKNFLAVPDDELGRNQVLLTMVGGKVVMALGTFANNTIESFASAIDAIQRPVASFFGA
ncbi:MAG: amidohydrolase [Rhodoferax sp.]|uniref:amidohydrolase n=1 Tax=Rhodoferax sp. TaxID=50421 RepID=UPI003267C5D1